jgi:hypothetical protein
MVSGMERAHVNPFADTCCRQGSLSRPTYHFGIQAECRFYGGASLGSHNVASEFLAYALIRSGTPRPTKGVGLNLGICSR